MVLNTTGILRFSSGTREGERTGTLPGRESGYVKRCVVLYGQPWAVWNLGDAWRPDGTYLYNTTEIDATTG